MLRSYVTLVSLLLFLLVTSADTKHNGIGGALALRDLSISPVGYLTVVFEVAIVTVITNYLEYSVMQQMTRALSRTICSRSTLFLPSLARCVEYCDTLGVGRGISVSEGYKRYHHTGHKWSGGPFMNYVIGPLGLDHRYGPPGSLMYRHHWN